VSEEAERTGRGAAARVLAEKETEGCAEIKTRAGEGVRYVLPQQISGRDRAVSLFMRVKEPNGQVRFVVSDDEKVLVTAKRLRAVPGEMEKIEIPVEKLQSAAGSIRVDLEVL